METDKETKKQKPKKKPKQQQIIYQLPQPIHPEHVKIGEFDISSQVFNAHQLLLMLLEALRDEKVKEYLNLIENKKQAGSYYG